MAKKKRTEQKHGGSSMLNPPERKAYAEGGGWTDSIGEFIYRILGRGFAKKVAEMKK